jgi:rfaE bifunctional protein nucleotidyltransferase chain/domain
MFDPERKIHSLEEMDRWVDGERQSGRKLGFTCGSFDLLHAGHVNYLAAARSACDRLIVAVNSDASVRRYKRDKKPLRPILREHDRMYLVAALESVDAVACMEDDRPLQLLQRWKPDMYIKGADYQHLRSADAVEAYGGKVVFIDVTFDQNTSKILERIRDLELHAVPEKVERQSRGLVLLDRDGTLIRDVPYIHEPSRVEVLAGVTENLKALQDAGFALAIVTNQQGIGLGYYSVDQFFVVNQRMLSLLGKAGVRISRIYFCPHPLADQCECRKPGSGMIQRAMRDFGQPAKRVVMVGDTDADRGAAESAGCRFVRASPEFSKSILAS